MSIQAVAWALDQDLPARPKLVLVSIANHVNHVDGYCWLKAETIAAEASCSPRAVFNFVGALIRNGYVRKSQRRGDDGKQRANDYWILLNREPSEWINSVDEIEAEEPAEPQDVVDGMHGVHAAETPEIEPENALQTAPCAPGPHAPACSHIDSAEPSKIKPKESAPEPYRPRGYKPPPPPRPAPQGDVVSPDPNNPGGIFVFFPSDAYDAWAKVQTVKSRLGFDVNGRPRWKLTITRVVDGKAKQGWYFPTLFPPAHADPPKESEEVI